MLKTVVSPKATSILIHNYNFIQVEFIFAEISSQSESEKEDLCENSIFTELLRDSKILFEKDCTPIAKNKKKIALEALTVAYNSKTKQNMNTMQILKKFNNMKTRIKAATDKNRIGNKKIVLKNWEKLFHELWTGEENNPFLNRVASKCMQNFGFISTS